MSRRLRVFLFFILFGGATGFISSNTSVAQIYYQVYFSEGDLVFKKESGFDQVHLKAENLTKGGEIIRSQVIGSPDLPIKLTRLILPSERDIDSVFVMKEYHLLLPGEFHILPCQLDEKTDGSSSGEWTEPDPVIYSLDSLYPGKLVELVDEGYMGGNHLVSLAIYPLQYKPKSRQLILYTQMEIKIELKDSNRQPVSSQIERRSDKTRRIYDDILYQFIENKNDVSMFAHKNFHSALSKANTDSLEHPAYLIITSSALRSAFLPLAEWKTQKGVKASIICMDSILSVYSGRDVAEKLRNFLIEAYQHGTTWVLLGGDEDVVPIRYAYPTNTSTPPEKTNQQICDLYFSDVDGDWDLDNDGIWGEPQQDRPDIYPDLFVGRVPCSDTAEAKAFVEKLLSYEKNPGNGSLDYLVSALWLSSDQMRDYSSGVGQHNLLSPYVPSSFSQDLSTLIESPAGYAENPTGPEGQTCVEIMQQGWGIIGVLAHGKSSGFVAKSNFTNGNPKSWVSTVPGGDDGHGHLPNLGNEQKYGIMYSISCSQSAIDVDKYPSLGGEPCVGEFYSLAPQKGGVAFLGYTRWGWVGLSYQLFGKLLEYLSSGNPEHHIGIAEALSRCAYPTYRDINYGHNLFGDPEMPVWTEPPLNATVSHPDEVGMGLQTIDFAVISQGTGLSDALICLTLGGKILFSGKTDANGHLSAEVNLEDVGEMSLVVTKTNFIPYEDSITVSLSADVDDEDAGGAIESFQLSQNYPNPFNPVTSIQFSVKSNNGRPVLTRIKVYNILGQLVNMLVDELKPSGNYVVSWDGKDENGKDVSSGIYFYTLETNGYRITKKMSLIK